MPNPVRVMHFADAHFGVENYGRQDPETGLNTRLLDFKHSLSKAIEMALAEGIDLAVFAGDAYKSRDPRQTDQREFTVHSEVDGRRRSGRHARGQSRYAHLEGARERDRDLPDARSCQRHNHESS